MRSISSVAAMLLSPALVLANGYECATDIPQSTPTERFEFRNGGATVLDTLTGLEWKRCSEQYGFDDGGTEGQFEDDSCLFASIESMSWQEALLHAEAVNAQTGELTPNGASGLGGYAGQFDWRVPNIKELGSIVEVACGPVGLNLDVFPGEEAGGHIVWSSSPQADPGGVSWGVDFANYGKDVYYGRTGFYHVRLVRDAQ